MTQSWRCARGHHWQIDREATLPPPGQSAVCPVCGTTETAAAPPLDETLQRPSGLASGAPAPAAPPVGSPSLDETLDRPAPATGAPHARGPAAPGADFVGETLAPPSSPSARLTGAPPVPPSSAPPPLGDTLQRPAGSAAPPSAPREDRPPVAGYEILDVLGRGGMGVVYKARQLALNRTVALKMILAGAHAGRDDLKRFRTEAEAVARLQHPNIVQIHEVGERDGLPFFSLEYVEGGSLQQKLNGTPVPAREAAALVEALARAIHHAHQQGIVHRDLKPANVLLDGQGVPKIADFGLAKRLEDDAGHTGTGAILGTPTYMAPEQAQGKTKEIGPAADIYSLGAILYDLLTGRPPFKGETVLDTLQQVQSVEPVPPRRLQPKVPRDLETVCLKCLEKDAARRYGSALALADDLKAFRGGVPILARPTPAWERALKWARRRPAAAALIGVSVLAVLLLGVGGVVVGARESHLANCANQARDAAVYERDEAQRQQRRADENLQQAFLAGDELLTRVSQDRLLNEPRTQALRRDLLHKARGFYQRFFKVEGDTPEVRWQTGQAHQRVAEIEEALGHPAEALESYRAALPLLKGLAEEFPARSEYRAALGGTHTGRGVVLQTLNRDRDAEEAYAAGIAALRELPEPADPRHRARLAGALNGWAGLVGRDRARRAEAEKAYREALKILDQLGSEPVYRGEKATALANLGVLLLETDRPGAEKAWAEAVALLKALVAESSEARAYRAELGRASLNLALLQEDGAPKQAARGYKEAADLFEQLVQDFPLTADYRQGLAQVYTNLGRLLEAHNEFDRAEEVRKKARGQWEKLAKDAPGTPAFRQELARSHADLGRYLWRGGEAGKAEAAWGEAVKLQEKLVAEHPDGAAYRVDLARSCIDLGQVAGKRGDADKEEGHYRKAIAALLEAKSRPGDWLRVMVDAQHNLIATLLERRRSADGVKALRDAIRYQREVLTAVPRDASQRQRLGSYYGFLLKTLADAGDHVGVSAAAKEYAPLLHQGGGGAWREPLEAAGQMARCVPLAEADRKLPETRRAELARAYGDEAVALLREAVRCGFRDAAQLQAAANLQPLAGRADFRSLVRDVETMAKTGAGG